MPEDDEVVLRKTVNGFCKSKRCAGNVRTATKTVFGNGTILVRCTKCNSDHDFIEGDNPGLDPNWDLGNGPSGDEGQGGADANDKDTPYRRRVGRK